ncbi:MAG: alcohol dehydrogenase catalytic domain-containing protein [Thermoplasmataceae archaeon]
MNVMMLGKPDKVENKPLKYTDHKYPEIDQGQVIVKVLANGVCHSDLHIIEGDFQLPSEMFPIIPGHEIVGEIVESKSDLRVGERVGIGWFYSACGVCDQCISGHENLCPNALVTGINKYGGYSEFAALDAQYVTRIPDDLKDKDAAPLFCAGITALSAVKRIHPNINDRIAVFGVGGLAFYAIQFIEAMGAKAVAVTRSHGSVAEKAGASEIVDRPSGGYDGSIVFAPSRDTVQKAVASTKSGRTIVIPAVMDRIDFPFGDFMWEKNVTNVASGLRKEAREILRLASETGLKSMITERKLEEANNVLSDLKRGKIQGRAVLIP